MATSRGNYVFPANESAKISNLGLIGGKNFGDSGKSYAIRPYGLEVEHRLEPVEGMPVYAQGSFRLMPTGHRLTTSSAEQDGWDGIFSGSVIYLPSLSHFLNAGFELGLRYRRWFLESGPIPSSGQLGVTVGVHFLTRQWDYLLEAGLMALGSASSPSIGVQRDSSTLRFRASYHLSEEREGFVPWLEFFHTHRSFFGSQLIQDQAALFFDEAALSLGVGYRF